MTGTGVPGPGELPAHEQHEAEAEEEKGQPGEAVLDADRLVVGGEDVLTPPAELVMIVMVRVVPVVVRVVVATGRVRFNVG